MPRTLPQETSIFLVSVPPAYNYIPPHPRNSSIKLSVHVTISISLIKELSLYLKTIRRNYHLFKPSVYITRLELAINNWKLLILPDKLYVL